MKASVLILVVVASSIAVNPAVADEWQDCQAFRCRYGDVPRPVTPLLAEPFHAFYADAVVRPLQPYRNLRSHPSDAGEEASARGGDRPLQPSHEDTPISHQSEK